MSWWSQWQRKERRHGYSFRGHLRRVVTEKGLRHIALSLGGTALVLSGAFAYCSSSNITGPSLGGPESKASGGLSPSGTGPTKSVSPEKKAVAVFPSDLLPAFHPCDPLLGFSEMEGQNEVTYTDEILYDETGKPTGEHRIRYNTKESQKGRDKNGKAYGHTKEEFGKSFTMTTGGGHNQKSHFHVEGEQPCTQTYNDNSASLNQGQDCTRSFSSEPSYHYTLVENPVTREGTLIVTTTSIVSSCPVAMRDQPMVVAMR
jgi:hypothetical protein